MTCSIDGCSKPAEKRGWCGMHYRRWQRHGDPLANLRPEQVQGPVAARFWAKVAKTDDGCWVWQGYRLPSGYGHFRVGGRDTSRSWLAHRLAYTLAVGPIPEGLTIDHLCVNPSCVRPDHLEAVTQQVNNHRSEMTQFKRNAAKTHCKYGHEFTPENTYVLQRDNGTRSQRVCRECGRIAQREYLQRKRGTVP